MVTPKQVAYRALERCGRLAIGQTPTSTLEDKANQAYAEIYAMLEDYGIVDWVLTDDLPDKYAYYVITLVSYNLCGDLRVSGETRQRIAADAIAAEREIRRLFNSRHLHTELKVCDY